MYELTEKLKGRGVEDIVSETALFIEFKCDIILQRNKERNNRLVNVVIYE